ncbi:hypothetical protein [Nonomuraea sp. NPDC049784]|uniref:hypothetical protein n=1 Tax=Nonomuraea sp. NPDC049784 TaxID=3154361 RepID=UPI0033E9BD8E
MKKSDDLPIFLADYAPSFARTAYLLTGDADQARELAVGALAEVGRRWSSVRWSHPVHAVLRELYGRYLGVTAAPALGGHALASLPPKSRAALVSRFHDGLPAEQAATVTGLWIAVLDEEARQAHAHLRTTHPELFPTPPQETPGEERPQPDEPAADQESWAPPSQAPGAAPAWDAADEPELRAALVRIAAEMPHTNLSGPVLRIVARRRRIRRSAWTAGTLGAVGVFAALTLIGVSAIARNIDRLPTTTADMDPQEIPEALPAKLSEPITSAYLGWCEGGGEDPSDPEPCDQWRLTTTSGEEWRLDGAQAGYDEPLAISQDGHRLAYKDLKGSYVVRDLPTGAVKKIDIRHQQALTHITSSPNGRYFAIDFGAADSAMLDFDTGVTQHAKGSEVRILAVGNDGTRVVSNQRDVNDLPGHASVTTLTVQKAQSRAGGYSIDPGLIEYGAALSPDGRTLALVEEGTRLITMNPRTGRVTGTRALLDDYDVIAIERWLSADDVLVRQSEEDDAFLTKVNVRTGMSESADYDLELDYDAPIGALN